MVKLGFYAGVEYKGKIYFSAYVHNGLYKMDLQTKRVEYITRFEMEKSIYMLHRAAFLDNNIAWFIPERGRYIVRVDLETFDMKYYAVSSEGDTAKRKQIFITGKRIDQKRICMIPREINDVVIIDVENDIIERIEGVIDREKEVTMDGFVYDNHLFLFFKNVNYCAKIDFNSGKREDVKIDEPVWSVLKVENQIWLITEESKKIKCYDLNKEKVINVFILDGNKKYIGLAQAENKAIGLPFAAPGFLYIDAETGEISEEIPKQIKLPNYANKTMQVDSRGGYYFSIGNTGLLATYCNGKMDYCNIEMDTKEFFDELAKSVTSSAEWNIFYDVLETIGMERVIGVDGMFYLMECLEIKKDNNTIHIGSKIWSDMKGLKK